MERSEDVSRKIEDHLSHGWRRKFMCTKQEVRESITASLLGIRANVRSEKILSTETQQYVLIRCMDVREQLLVLLKRGDRRHVKTLMRILRSFEHTVAMMMNTDQSSDDVSSS